MGYPKQIVHDAKTTGYPQGGGLQGQRLLSGSAGNKPLSQLAAEFGIHPTLIAKWRDAAVQTMVAGFEWGAATHRVPDAEAENKERQIAELYEQVGPLTLQVNWLKKSGLDPDAR